eukprot:scaffold72895_cov30-Tisochrysis_lutea.AAC.4
MRNCHAECRRDGRGRVTSAEDVVLRLGTLGEPRDATVLAERGHAVAPACQDLVRIDLMRDVEDDRVLRRVEDVV